MQTRPTPFEYNVVALVRSGRAARRAAGHLFRRGLIDADRLSVLGARRSMRGRIRSMLQPPVGLATFADGSFPDCAVGGPLVDMLEDRSFRLAFAASIGTELGGLARALDDGAVLLVAHCADGVVEREVISTLLQDRRIDAILQIDEAGDRLTMAMQLAA